MIRRHLEAKILALARQFPVVSITGPRQSGKTTLARMTFPDHAYANLEEPDVREFAATDPRGFLRRFRGGVILDEIQRVPQLLSYLQGVVDADETPGRFILTGSHQFHLMAGVSQTLAGRTAVVHLLPLSLAELMGVGPVTPLALDSLPAGREAPPWPLETILFKGMYPRIHARGVDARDWLSAYYRTYVERDVRELRQIGDLDAFQRFVRLCAGRTGQVLNLSSLAADCGISHTTARQWLSVLQAGFIVHLLPPHHANFSKRLIKSPKLYFLDTGLLCYLLLIRSPEEVLHHALRGPIFETFVLSELYKGFANLGEAPPLYFWRDQTGHEVDIVIDAGMRLVPVEIKSAETLSQDLFRGLRYYLSLSGSAARTGVLVYGGRDSFLRDGLTVRAWHTCS